MAGPYWHFYTANLALERLENNLKNHSLHRCIIDHRSHFLAGVQGPDYNFYPKGNIEISNLAHGSQPADLGRCLLKLAKTDQERSFAYGWLMHLTTDNITHPLVNRLILEHFPRKTRNGTDPSVYPLGHHRVEWGIDVNLFQNSKIVPYLPDTSSTLCSAIPLASLMKNALGEIFQFDLTEEVWQNAINSMIKYQEIFHKAWLMTGRIKDRNLLKRWVKEVAFHSLVSPVAKILAWRNPENGLGVLIPIRPRPQDVEAVFECADRVCSAFDRHIQEDFSHLPNDTG